MIINGYRLDRNLTIKDRNPILLIAKVGKILIQKYSSLSYITVIIDVGKHYTISFKKLNILSVYVLV